MSSDTTDQVEIPINSRLDPTITTQVPYITLVYVNVSSNILRYVYHEPMCYVTIGHESDWDFCHDQYGRWSRVELRFDPDSVSI